MRKILTKQGLVRGLTILIPALGFSFFILASDVYAATLEVGQGRTYSTIQAAVNAANPGDIINVFSGTYTGSGTEVVTISGKNNLTIQCNPGSICTISGQNARAIFISQGNDGIILDGFAIRNCNGSTYYGAKCIWMQNGDDLVVRNLNIDSSNSATTPSQEDGIIVFSNCNNCKAYGNTLTGYDSTIGIACYKCDNGKIYDNDISGGNDHGAGLAAHINVKAQSENTQVYRNYLHDCISSGAGILTRANDPQDDQPPVNTTAYSNVIVNCYYGFRYWRGRGYYFYNNTIVGTGTSDGSSAFANSGLNGNVEVKNNILANFNYGFLGDTRNGSWLLHNNLYFNVADKFHNTSFEQNPGSYSESNELFNTNPQFVGGADPLGRKLQASSPGVNSGTSSFNPDSARVPVDFDGVPRPQGSGFDRGAFELLSGADTTPPAAPTGLRVQ